MTENADAEAIELPAMDCEFFVDNEEIKKLELEYFNKMEFQDSFIFGGTMRVPCGRVTAIATTADQKLFAQAVDDGTILVYETEFWQLVRLFDSGKNRYDHLEFSHDNSSQLLALTDKGVAELFLLKGYNPPDNLSSIYIAKSEILMYEDLPLILIPYYNLNFSHFLTDNTPQREGLSDTYKICAAAFHPSISIIAFQNSLVIASASGMIMKWNSNISTQTMRHKSEAGSKLYGVFYGKVITDYDIPFPAGHDDPESIANLTKPAQIEKRYPEIRKYQTSARREQKDGAVEIKAYDQRQINREFFDGHKAKVVFLCQVENGKDILSVDQQGHIFIWKYEPEYFDMEAKMYRPAHKYRIPLTYTLFKAVEQFENQNAKVEADKFKLF